MVGRSESLDVEFPFDNDFGDALQRVNQQILEFRHLFRLAANAANFAANPFGGFLTLVTNILIYASPFIY